ncbi:hypothetical protein VTK26DRAFT_342 [Humicola hyalothermophila]
MFKSYPQQLKRAPLLGLIRPLLLVQLRSSCCHCRFGPTRTAFRSGDHWFGSGAYARSTPVHELWLGERGRHVPWPADC